MTTRRAFLSTAIAPIGLSRTQAARAAQPGAARPPLDPLVWPIIGGQQAGIRTFAGHIDTVVKITRLGGVPIRPTMSKAKAIT